MKSSRLHEHQECEDLLIIGMRAHDEQWTWIFVEETAGDVIQTAAEWAAHPDLSFTFQDASRVVDCIENNNFEILP